jgi:hypothetical protein
MKDSGAPSIGDLVVALYDEERDISCVGLVTETKGIECKILWSSDSDPIGWAFSNNHTNRSGRSTLKLYQITYFHAITSN